MVDIIRVEKATDSIIERIKERAAHPEFMTECQKMREIGKLFALEELGLIPPDMACNLRKILIP